MWFIYAYDKKQWVDRVKTFCSKYLCLTMPIVYVYQKYYIGLRFIKGMYMVVYVCGVCILCCIGVVIPILMGVSDRRMR